MPPRTYPNPGAFKTALDARLQQQARQDGTSFNRKRMLLVFHRFLARIDRAFAEAVLLKGGLALELRLTSARTTRDVDLRMVGSADNLLARLQDAGLLDLGDFLRFEVQVDPHHPELRDIIYEGRRFKATCTLAGRLYGDPFGVDIGFGDPVFGAPQTLVAPDDLGFIGIPPPSVKVYPLETHIAEKLHAYTLPRTLPNSRVKDLPDLALLASTQPLTATAVRTALAQTFSFRATHPVPHTLPAPPHAWTEPYDRLARTNGLRWTTLEQLTEAVRGFLDPVLTSAMPLVWSPGAWRWHAASAAV